jgi:hypothetical protein
MQFKCFKKIETKILNVDNFEIYNPENFQFKIWCILGYRKKEKSNKISNFENVHFEYFETFKYQFQNFQKASFMEMGSHTRNYFSNMAHRLFSHPQLVLGQILRASAVLFGNRCSNPAPTL